MRVFRVVQAMPADRGWRVVYWRSDGSLSTDTPVVCWAVVDEDVGAGMERSNNLYPVIAIGIAGVLGVAQEGSDNILGVYHREDLEHAKLVEDLLDSAKAWAELKKTSATRGSAT